jgi:hypothetical protein
MKHEAAPSDPCERAAYAVIRIRSKAGCRSFPGEEREQQERDRGGMSR